MEVNRLTDGYFVSPQILPEDIKELRAMGFDLVINNRPDGEEPDQPAGEQIAAACEAEGLSYISIPIDRNGVSTSHLDAFDQATSDREKIFAFCRTGTRSTVLKSLAAARAGVAPDTLVQEAASAGYDISGQYSALISLGKG